MKICFQRIILVVGLLCGLFSVVRADDKQSYDYLVIVTNEGKYHFYDLGEHPELKLDGPNITVSTDHGSTSYAPGTVREYVFHDNTTKTETLPTDYDLVIRRISADVFYVGGRDARSAKVVGLDGVVYRNSASIPAEGAKLDLSSLSAGVYIIVVNDSKSIKIIK